jgi:hypothetical protein
MSDATLRIKNLSIALEALSRVNRGYASTDLATRLEELLNREIKEEEKHQGQQAWPAKSIRDMLDDNTSFSPHTKA